MPSVYLLWICAKINDDIDILLKKIERHLHSNQASHVAVQSVSSRTSALWVSSLSGLEERSWAQGVRPARKISSSRAQRAVFHELLNVGCKLP